MPIVKKLLSMKPAATEIAAAVAALYSELAWPPGPDHALLRRMLDMVQQQMEGATPVAYGQLLAGCVAAGWRPDDRWLAEHHAAAAKALRDRQGVKAEALVRLINGLLAIEQMAKAGPEGQGAPAAAGPGSKDAGGALAAAGASKPPNKAKAAPVPKSTYQAAREELLVEIAHCLLREPAVRTLAAKPDLLVDAVRQVVVQGARPDEQWVQQLTDLTRDLVPQLSAKGLAYAAESLALLGAAPSASFIDTLLTQAGKFDLKVYDPKQLGLLLGGVHTLRQAAIAEDELRRLAGDGSGVLGGKAGPLSTAAQEAWGRAHATFVSQARNVLPSYTPVQMVMVVGGVAAFELTRPAVSTPAQTAPRGKSHAAAPGRTATSATAVADLIGRVEDDWLSDCLAALLRCREVGLEQQGQVPLPPPGLLIDLLRLASRVMRGRSDGGIAVLVARPQAGTDGTVEPPERHATRAMLLRYLKLSMTDLADTQTAQAAAAARSSASVMQDRAGWSSLLHAAYAAGIRAAAPELSCFATALVDALWARVGNDMAIKEEQQGALMAELEDGIQGVLLPALPWKPEGRDATLLLKLLQATSLLQACSPRQLALLCTYATQSGLGSQLMWERVAQSQQAAALAVGAFGADASAAAADAWDRLSVRYALYVAGQGVKQAGKEDKKLVSCCLGQLAQGSIAPARGAVNALRALQVLWVAHRCGLLAQAPRALWDMAYSTTDLLRLLLPYQLAQLVELRSAAAAEGVQLQPPPTSFLNQWLAALESKGDGSGGVRGALAVRAVTHSGGARTQLIKKALLALGDTRGPRIVSAEDAAECLLAVERHTAKGVEVQLTASRTRVLVARLVTEGPVGVEALKPAVAVQVRPSGRGAGDVPWPDCASIVYRTTRPLQGKA